PLPLPIPSPPPPQLWPQRQRNARGRLSCVGSLERGRSTDYDEKALLSQDVQSNIAPASSEPYGVTTIRGTKATTSSQARAHGAAL
ncbi:unnamed protein product, partial [Brassica oleracea var. botrytis]